MARAATAQLLLALLLSAWVSAGAVASPVPGYTKNQRAVLPWLPAVGRAGGGCGPPSQPACDEWGRARRHNTHMYQLCRAQAPEHDFCQH